MLRLLFVLRIFPFFFFLLFFQSALVDFFTINNIFMYYLRIHKFYFSAIFSIKNRSHGTIYTFKNYFTTVFLVPNEPIGDGSSLVSSCICLLVGCVFVFYGGN